MSDTNEKYVLISSPVEITEKVNLFNKDSYKHFESQTAATVKYISIGSPSQMNRLYYVIYHTLF